MALEIERKFLVADDNWSNSIIRRVHIRDGLLCSDNDRKVRVRILDNSATITVKSHRVGVVRAEFEYAIPLSDAEEMIRSLPHDRILEKWRHLVPYEGLNWEIDVYEGILQGVVVAEIEMKTETQMLRIPPWIGREVTGDPKYRKLNMVAERMATIDKTIDT
jgi:adenylate cyclase